MRTLIITGTATPLKKGVSYNVFLYGQTEEHPVCVFICPLEITCTGYSTFIDICKQKYTNYFKTNEFNIISMDNLHMLPAPAEKPSTPKTVRKIWRALISLNPKERTDIYHKYLKEHGCKEELEQKAAAFHSYLQEYKAAEPQLLFYLWYQAQYMHTRFPRGFTSWHQTFHLFSKHLSEMRLNPEFSVFKIAEHGGTFAVADLAFHWTNAFEKKYKHTRWALDLDFFNALYNFIDEREQRYKHQLKQAS